MGDLGINVADSVRMKEGFGPGHSPATPPAAPDLGVSVSDEVKAREAFGQVQQQLMKGIAGTLHLTTEADAEKVGKLALHIARERGLPAIIVVRPVA